MSFNEKSARKVINFLLKEDIDDFSRWLPEIENFNSEQIENLLKGEIEYIYPIKNKNIFAKLVMKFDNYEKLTSKWYQKEENYKYLKELWLQYICIEDIRELIKNDENDEKLINFLKKKKINYSQWPKEVKDEFKVCVNRTIGSCIHEEEIKKALNEEHSNFSKVQKIMDETYESFKNGFKDIGKQAQKRFEQNCSSIMKSVLFSLFGLIAFKIASTASGRINYKLLKKSLVKQILNYIPNKEHAKLIAKEIIAKNFGPEICTIKWEAGDFNFCDDDDVDGCTNIGGLKKHILSLDLTEKKNEVLSLGQRISTISKNNIICGLVAFSSLLNLGYSVIEFTQISNIIKTIAGKEYEKKLNKIKESFEQHIKELDLGGDCNYFLSKINYVKGNIESDKQNLINLIIEINADIKLLEKKKHDSTIGLISSIVVGGIAAVGTFGASGIQQGIYAISVLGNIFSGATNGINISKCNESIEELTKIKKNAELEKQIIEKKLKQLNLKIKQKDLAFPQFYEEYEDLIQNQNKIINNYYLNKNYF